MPTRVFAWDRLLSLAPDFVTFSGSIFEIRLKQPGEYPFVTHAFADATKGAVGVLSAKAATAAPR